MIVGIRGRKERKKLGISQAKLADLVGVSKASISNYENDLRMPSLETFIELLNVFRVPADYLLGRDVSVVTDYDAPYNKLMTKGEVEIINQLRMNPRLYRVMTERPKRAIASISNKLR